MAQLVLQQFPIGQKRDFVVHRTELAIKLRAERTLGEVALS